MKKLILTLAACLFVMHAEALLPPLYQGSGEIKAIMEDSQLAQKLSSGDVIMKIEKNEEGYAITTNKHHLQAYVDYELAQHPGPAHYKIRFGEALPL